MLNAMGAYHIKDIAKKKKITTQRALMDNYNKIN